MGRRPKFIDYTPFDDMEPWRVRQFAELASEISNLTGDDLADFHEFANTKHPTAWLMCRMLYGISPVIPKSTVDSDYLKEFSRLEIETKLKVTAGQCDVQLARLSATWSQRPKTPVVKESLTVATAVKQEPVEVFTPPDTTDGILSDEQRARILEYGFSLEMFNVGGRSETQKLAEMMWFAGRLEELRKVFEEPMVKSTARMAVLNELQLRRADDRMSITEFGSKEFMALQDTKGQIETIYAKQWAQLEEMCPHAKAASTRVSVAGVVSDWIDGYAKFISNGDNSILDGLFTAFEIQVENRQSEQSEVRYRPGLIVAINDARQGLWDPTWKRSIPMAQLQVLDDSYRKAQKEFNEKHSVILPNLEADGPGGEYPDLVSGLADTPLSEAIEIEDSPAAARKEDE
jgi:hypothetical protein